MPTMPAQEVPSPPVAVSSRDPRSRDVMSTLRSPKLRIPRCSPSPRAFICSSFVHGALDVPELSPAPVTPRGAQGPQGCSPPARSGLAPSQGEEPSGRPGSTSTTPGGTGTTRAWRPFASTTVDASASGRWPSRPAPPSGSCPRTWARWCTSAPRRVFAASTRSSRRARPAPTITSDSSAHWVSARPHRVPPTPRTLLAC